MLKGMGITCIFWNELLGDFDHPKNIHKYPKTRPSKEHRLSVVESDPLLYIFTSGTTGLPKSSKISHTRYITVGMPLAFLTHMKRGDRIYCTLPLYHSVS